MDRCGLEPVHLPEVQDLTVQLFSFRRRPPLSFHLCTKCPENAISPVGSTSNCKCKSGFSGPNGEICTACLAGKYKNTTGSSQCTSCPDGSSSAQKSVSVTACRCVPGTAGINGGHCVNCPVGTYKSVSGPGNCTVSPQNAITSTVGSSNESDCACDKGFSNDNGRGCVACEPGKYKDETGPTKCLGCPTNSFANASSTRLEDCKCNQGFVSNGTTCTNPVLVTSTPVLVRNVSIIVEILLSPFESK